MAFVLEMPRKVPSTDFPPAPNHTFAPPKIYPCLSLVQSFLSGQSLIQGLTNDFKPFYHLRASQHASTSRKSQLTPVQTFRDLIIRV